MSELIFFYLLFWWLIQIFYKITELDQEDCKIKTYVRRIKQKQIGDFLSNLVDCQLCMESHIGFLISIFLVYNYCNYEYILLGYSAAGFNNIVKRIIER